MKKIILFSMSLVLLVSSISIYSMHGKRVDWSIAKNNDPKCKQVLKEVKEAKKRKESNNGQNAKHEALKIKKAQKNEAKNLAEIQSQVVALLALDLSN